MSRTSPVSVAFHEAFHSDWMPLLESIGLSSAKPSHVKPGLVVELAKRPLDARRSVEATLWCNGGSGLHLSFRLDIAETIDGVVHYAQVQLPMPWPEPSARRAGLLDSAVRELLPHESIERLRLGIAFLAGGFAASAETIAQAIPELASEIRSASRTALWLESAARAAGIWKDRHVRGEIEDEPVDAKLVFGSDKLVYLDAKGVRLMFRIAAHQLDRTRPITVSGWRTTAAGTRVATTLVQAGQIWTFDLRGEPTTAGGN